MSGRTVWVIEHGCYSDYSVVGVFSSRENAERAAAFAGYDESEIAEWPLDPGIEELNQGRRQFRVRMLRDGTSWVEESSDISASNAGIATASPCRLGPFADRAEFRGAMVLLFDVWATDEAHAVKIVNERRAQLLASGEWDKAGG